MVTFSFIQFLLNILFLDYHQN